MGILVGRLKETTIEGLKFLCMKQKINVKGQVDCLCMHMRAKEEVWKKCIFLEIQIGLGYNFNFV